MSLGFSLISLALGAEREGCVCVCGGGVGRLGMSHCYAASGQHLNGYISMQPNPVDTMLV